MIDDDESGSQADRRIEEQDALATALLTWLQRLATLPPARTILCRVVADTEAPWPSVPCGIPILVCHQGVIKAKLMSMGDGIPQIRTVL